MVTDYAFLVDTYASERLKTLSVWAMFDDADLDVRPHPNLARDRTFREHMVHQLNQQTQYDLAHPEQHRKQLRVAKLVSP